MKPKFLILTLVLFLSGHLAGQGKFIINFPYKGLSFEAFVTITESRLPVRFFYKESWVAGLMMSDYPGCHELPCILDHLFRDKSLNYFIDDNGNIVLTGNYMVRDMNASGSDDSEVIKTDDQVLTSHAVKDRDTLNLVIGNPKDRDKSGNVVVTGWVINGSDGKPVAGANVYIRELGKGTMTNSSGHFSLILPRGYHQLRISFIGMTEKQVNLDLCGPGQITVDIEPDNIRLKEVVISSGKNNVLERFEAGAENLNIATFRLLPTSLGETDILKNLVLIPGVKSVGEGSAGFNVRGGSADQNLILLNGAPVYNASHFFGFFSAVNSDLISEVTLFKGGIPGRYGGRISSVLDIGTKDGNPGKFAGKAGISPITTRLMVEGPLIKDTLTYLLAGRTTYSNWIFGLLKDTTIRHSRASFRDLNGKLTWYLNEGNKINLSAYFSKDNFMLNQSLEYHYSNKMAALEWHHDFNNLLYADFSLNNSYYEYSHTNQDYPPAAYIRNHRINSSGLKTDFTRIKGKNEMNFGMDITRYAVMPGSYRPATDSSLIIPVAAEQERAFEAALYYEEKFVLTKFLSIHAGLRISSIFSVGPKTILTYSRDFPKSISTVTDTLFFKKGEVYSRYGGPELRLSANFRLSEWNSLKINYNQTRQYIHLLSNSVSIAPTDTWKLCDYHLKPETGDQIAAGFYRLIPGGSFETSAEVYYKVIRNMVDYKGGSTLSMTGNLEQTMINVNGKAWGMELALKKTAGRVRFNVAYTWSRTLVRSTGKFREEMINSGNWYPANCDKPHDLIITFNYFRSRRLSFSADYTYSSGRPVTYPLSTYHLRNILFIQYSDRNKYRIPYYSRFDVSCTMSGNLKTTRLAHPNLTFSVYNLFGRENPYSVYFTKKGQVIKGHLLSVFGTAIPSVAFNFEF